MGGGFYFFGEDVSSYSIIDDIFTPGEIEAIINIGKDSGLSDGLTAGGLRSDARDSSVSFIFPNELTHWIFEKLSNSILEVNRQFYHFELHGLFQGLQFTAYHAPSQHYGWHVDMGSGTARKLSVTVQLSDPSEYEGGLLELQNGGNVVTVDQKKGIACFFPSWTLHRVTPVTRGTRYSLVAWVSGPSFK